MHLYPAHIEQKLGFDIIRERLEASLLSVGGKIALAANRPSADRAWMVRELEAVDELQRAIQFDDPLPLESFGDIIPILKRLSPTGAVADVEELAEIRRLLGLAKRLRGYFQQRKDKYPALWEALRPIDPLPALVRFLESVVDYDGRISDHASPDLRRLRRTLLQQENAARAAASAELSRCVDRGFAADEQPTVRGGRLVIPVRAEAKRKVKGFVHDTSATGQTVYIEPASCLDLNNEVRSLQLEVEHEIRRILRNCADRIRESATLIENSVAILTNLDVRQAKARLAAGMDAMVPDLSKDGSLRLVSAKNPVLLLRQVPGALQSDKSVVPLDLEMDPETRVLVISGPNAGGKSVVMKTVGVFALMLANGIPIPAKPGTTFPVYEKVFADVGDEQSVENDLSTFGSHVENMRTITAGANGRSLVLIDEAGTGTDPAEGSALAQAVLEQLNNIGATTIVTTHQTALKVFATETTGVENASLQFDLDSLEPTYVFQTGIPGASYAFDVATRLGLKKDILERARSVAGADQVRLEQVLAAYAENNRRLTEKLGKIEEERKRYEDARRTHERERQRFEESADAICAGALAEAEQLLKQSNARIERTIREIKEANAEAKATKAARKALDDYKKAVTSKSKKTRKKQQKRKKPSVRNRHVRLEPGDRVVLDDGQSEMVVDSVKGAKAVIVGGSAQMTVDTRRLTRVGGPKKQQVHVVSGKVERDRPAMRASTRIDIRGKRVDEALPIVTRFLDDCMATGLDRAEIVHGSGTGALRNAVRDMLGANPDVSGYEEPTWDHGGPGVTIVHFV